MAIFHATSVLSLGCLLVMVFPAFQPVNKVYAACNIIDGKKYGDCAGVTINQENKGHLTVTSVVHESGIIEGATIRNGGVLNLSGMSTGDIIVSRGGELNVSGIVNGTIMNNGGSVEVEGIAQRILTKSGRVTIGGIVEGVTGWGAVVYRKGAVVGGAPVE